MKMNLDNTITSMPIKVPVGNFELRGDLAIPDTAHGLVVFAHGSGSSRMSPRNQYVARVLNEAGMATLLIDLLTPEEEQTDSRTRELRFDIEMLGERLVEMIDWLVVYPKTQGLRIALFGASTGAAAAILAAARRNKWVSAVVSRGGRPDLAAAALPVLQAPTILIVGAEDYQVLDLNRQALAQISTTKSLVTVPGATHLFEEPGTLEKVAALARNWLLLYL